MFVLRLLIPPIMLLLLIVSGFLGYVYYTTKQVPTIQSVTTTFNSVTTKVSETSPKVQDTTMDAGSQLQTLTHRAGEVSQHAQNVLGTSIQVNEEEKRPIHESAIEYGRYIYCKQAVMDYEAAVKDSEKSSTEESN